jgi:hypothetical protein
MQGYTAISTKSLVRAVEVCSPEVFSREEMAGMSPLTGRAKDP